MAANSVKGYDAASPDGTRYQVEARRLTAASGSRQLSPVRGLADGHFDELAAVLFAAGFPVLRAAIMPRRVVVEQFRHSRHVNGHLFIFRDSVRDRAEVRDMTAALAAAQESGPITTA